MKLSEKLVLLRKKYNYSQDDIAEKCGVTRQSISKWEAGLAYPEVTKLVILSKLFNETLDVLMKDDLLVDAKHINNTCHTNITSKISGLYQGILIKESLTDDSIIDILNINKVELWESNDIPKYWTALYFSSNDNNLAEKFSKVINPKPLGGSSWYVDFKYANTHYVVFYQNILKYEIGNKEEKNKVLEVCKKYGISDIED